MKEIRILPSYILSVNDYGLRSQLDTETLRNLDAELAQKNIPNAILIESVPDAPKNFLLYMITEQFAVLAMAKGEVLYLVRLGLCADLRETYRGMAVHEGVKVTLSLRSGREEVLDIPAGDGFGGMRNFWDPSWSIYVLPEAIADEQQKSAIRNDGDEHLLIVEGGPGCGKTIAAYHRARYLLEREHRAFKKVIFLSYNREITQQHKRSLEYLKIPSHNIQVELIQPFLFAQVTNLGWSLNCEQFEFPADVIPQGIAATAVRFDLQNVLLPSGGVQGEQYINSGKAHVAGEKDRRHLKENFTKYWQALTDKDRNDIQYDLIGAFLLSRLSHPGTLKMLQEDFKDTAFVVDEAQDLEQSEFAVFCKLATRPGQISLFRDLRQSIKALHGKGYMPAIPSLTVELRTCYRTSAKVAAFLREILVETQGLDSLKDLRFVREGSDDDICVMHFDERNVQDELKWIQKMVQQERQRNPQQMIALLSFNGEKRDELSRLFSDEEALTITKENSGRVHERRPIYIANIHHAKGLDFQTVFVVGYDYERPQHEEDRKTQLLVQVESDQKRCLELVGLTRATERLYVSGAAELLARRNRLKGTG